MKLPPSAIIAESKVTGYLLKWRPEDDKSQFLAQAGYNLEDPDLLVHDIRKQLLPCEAELIEQTEYGPKYLIRGSLAGPNGHTLRVRTVWMIDKASGEARFITLFPERE